MTKTNDVKVVSKAGEEYSRVAGSGNSARALNSSLSGAGTGAGLSYDLLASVYGMRLDAERDFQLQRLAIIKSAKVEESAVIGEHISELRTKEKEDHDTKLEDTKVMINSSLSLMKTLVGGNKKNNKTMFEADKVFSVGKAVMNAYGGASKAFETYAANPPMASLMAGIALVKGLAIAKSIASQRMSKSVGSGGLGAGGGSVGARSSTVPYATAGEDEKRATQSIVVNIHNPLSDENWGKIVEDNIIPAIESAGERNVLLDINV